MTKAPPNSEARIAFSEIRDVQSQLSNLDASGIIDWALARFGQQIAFASSFGPEDIVLIDLAFKTGKPFRVFTLDTARLHTETYQTWQSVESRYNLSIETLFPAAEEVAALVKKQGPNGFYDSVENRRACCDVRKVIPLRAQLKNLDAWVTGMRKDQSANRANVQHVEIDLGNGGLAKFNPLADWSEADVWDHIKTHKLPYNPLHDEGFPSIGCAPCTRAVKPGDDLRSGRWWWESKDENECGIHQHVKNAVEETSMDDTNIPSFWETNLSESEGLMDTARYSPRDDMPDYSHLDELENQSMFILREAFNKFHNLAMLWSIGKDSSVMLWLARKAFFGHVPFPCVHVDTSYKIPEMIQFRDDLAERWNLDLRVGGNKEALAEGKTFPNGSATRVECCSLLKRDALQDVIAKNHFEAVILGIRRDEEGTRAKERYFSPRTKDFEWDFRDQPPELWDQFKTDFEPGTHLRIHPLLHWTEQNIWEYVDRERIPVVPLYFANEDGMRYRSLGCAPCTSGVESTAKTVPEIIEELRTTQVAERSTRAQDQEAEDAFERLRASGYM